MPADTTRDAARWAVAALFRAACLPSPDLDARVLVCAACGIDHAAFVRAGDHPLGVGASTLRRYVERRLRREPVARILGRREFWGLSFALTADVLDPRPETEGLVASVLDAVGGRSNAPLRILDLGTGSGALLCALLHELPRGTGVGVDRSLAACRVARENIGALGLDPRAHVVCGSWGAALNARFDVVVSNPPYIARGDLPGLEIDVREHDPVAALDGGVDGLDAYRAFFPQLGDLLAEGGVVVVECGWDGGPRVAALMGRHRFGGVAIYRDLAGHGRVVIGSRSVNA